MRDLDPNVELLFVGSSAGPEKRIASDAGIPFKSVASAPFPKSFAASEFLRLVRIVRGLASAVIVLRAFRPDVAVGTGGYTTAPVLLAQRLLRKPLVIHEQNVIPGRANRWISQFADRVCITFDSSASCFPRHKVLLTGLPIRKEFLNLPSKKEARKQLSFREDLFTLLVVGGSLGARRLNELMFEAWTLINDGATQVLHQAGAGNTDQIEEWSKRQLCGEQTYRIEPYVDMPVSMAAADLLIGRSGASTLAEAMAACLPCILVPYPHSVSGEQMANARHIADRGAAIVFSENELTPQKLASAVTDLRSSPERLQEMSEASRSLSKPNAAADVAKVVVELASKVKK